MRYQKIIRGFHRTAGLGAGLLIVLTSLTGSLLAFQREIDRTLNPSLWRVEPGSSLATLEQVRAVVEAAGGPAPRMLLMPDQPDRSLLVLLAGQGATDRWEVFVDPYRARVLGRRRFGTGWTERLKRFHVELFAGRPGRHLVGLGGMTSLALGGTGFWLWWRFRPRATGSMLSHRRGVLALHRQIGIFSLIPLTIVTTTGLFLSFRPILAPILNLATGPLPLEVAPRSESARAAESMPPTLDQVRDRALAAYPDAQVTRIYLPEGPDGTFAARLRLPGERNPHGNTAILFDRYDGRVLQQHGSRTTSAVQKLLWYAPYPWHTGDALGTLGRSLVCMTGLTTALLMATGVIHWARLRRRLPVPGSAFNGIGTERE